MEHLPDIIRAMAEYGISPLNLVLILMMYFMGAQSGVFPKFWGGKIDSTPDWAKYLLQHFNHDTTDFHKATHTKLDTLIEKEEEEAKERTEMRDDVKNIQHTLDTFEKFGVITRRKLKEE